MQHLPDTSLTADMRHWKMATLVDVAQWRVEQHPDQRAFTFLLDGESEEALLTYGDLDRRAKAIAAELQSQGALGQRVLIVLEPGVDYIAALYGCFYAGAIAVPVYPPDPFRIARTLPRLQAIFKNAGCQRMVTTKEILGGPESAVRQICPSGAIVMDRINPEQAIDWQRPPSDADQVALLQYTSGTTGTPRGVAITNGNLLYNLRVMEQQLDVENAIALHWLPPYHDLGLIGGIFLPLYAGRQMVLLSPLHFMQKPARWLQAISNYQATTSAAPNFGYELCLRKISEEDCEGLDLSNWSLAVSGAEAVRSDTLTRFTERFEPYGFRRDAFVSAYGMAETTLMVSCGQRFVDPTEQDFDAAALTKGEVLPIDTTVESAAGKEVTSRRLVSCGPPAPETIVRIVDPETLLPTEGVGEILVNSPGVADGYWRLNQATNATFNIMLPSTPGSNEKLPFLRTGDLGFWHDEELYVVGRLKEMVILGGRNFYPQDIELAIQSTHPALKLDAGAIAAVEADHQEQLVVFQEVQRAKRQNLDELSELARQTVFAETGQEPYAVLLLPVGELPKTSSGKTRRNECWAEYQNGNLTIAHQWLRDGDATTESTKETSPFEAPTSESEQWLADVWQATLDVSKVGRACNFFSLGGRSLQVTEVLHQASRRCGQTVPLEALFKHPTLGELAAHLDTLSRSSADCRASCDPKAIESVSADWLDTPRPLSASQQRLWLMEQAAFPGAANVPVAIQLAGSIDPQRVTEALNAIIQRHPLLQTRFDVRADDGLPRQTRVAVPAVEVEVLNCPASTNDPLAWALDHTWTRKPFSIDRPPLLRAAMAHLSDGQSLLILVAHHLVVDGASISTLLGELQTLLKGEPLSVAGPSYADYLADSLGVGTDERTPKSLKDAASYWQERLADLPAAIDLPLDALDAVSANPRDGVQAVRQGLSPEQIAAVETRAVELGVTPFVMHLAAYQLTLASYAQQLTVGVGVAVANRTHEAWRETVGCFINTVPLAATVAPSQKVADFVTGLRDDVLQDLQHAAMAWEAIIDAAGKPRLPRRMPLVQSFLVYDDNPVTVSELDGSPVLRAATDYRGLSGYDATLVVETRGEPKAELIYDQSRCSEAIAKGLLATYTHVLTAIAADPQVEVRSLPLGALPESQHHFGPSKAEAPSLLARLSEQSQKQPTATALICGEQSLTYGQLQEKSLLTAATLIEQGIQAGDRVAVLATRSIDLLPTLLGIWQAGAAYVPLDPSYPAKRLQAVLDSSEPRLVVLGDQLDEASLITELDLAKTIKQSRLFNQPSAAAPVDLRADLDGELAYVMYTSGSTGTPKGVMVPHLAIGNFLQSFADEIQLTTGHRMLAATTIAFDISVLELFLPLYGGATVVLTDTIAACEPQRLVDQANSVTHLQGTPSMYRLLLAAGWEPKAEQTLLCGGEELTPDLATTLLSGLQSGAGQLWNVYGPTETTIWSTSHCFEKTSKATRVSSVPIGKPIDNTSCYILSKLGGLAPVGAWGELAIGGRGVAAGYWQQPDLTAERFPTNPYALSGASYYLTGDVARWTSAGLLEFRGRNDRQVKVRGHRIELSEIEIAMTSHASVAEAAAIAVDQESQHARLVAYYVTQPGHELSADELQQHLAIQLPHYMVPASLVPLSELPRTDNGKLDRAALPRTATTAVVAPPETPLQQQLADWCCALLRIDEIGIHDNFFERGGQSLLAMQLVVRVREQTGVELPMRAFYERPTVADWATLITSVQLENTTADESQAELELLAQLESMSDEEAVAYLAKLTSDSNSSEP